MASIIDYPCHDDIMGETLLTQNSVEQALQVFGLTAPLTADLLEKRYRELLGTWHPHRYANLTNNPKKYMQMYKKGEEMSREVRAAYKVLAEWLGRQ